MRKLTSPGENVQFFCSKLAFFPTISQFPFHKINNFMKRELLLGMD